MQKVRVLSSRHLSICRLFQRSDYTSRCWGAPGFSRLTAMETDHRTRERRQGITLTVQARSGETRRDQAARRPVIASRRPSSRPSRWAIRSRSINTSARNASSSRLNSRSSRLNSRCPFRMRPAKPTPTRRIVKMTLMTASVIVITAESCSERGRRQCKRSGSCHPVISPFVACFSGPIIRRAAGGRLGSLG